MLESLDVNNFTAFSNATFQFAPGLNVIIGENGSGKTHVLKLAYTCLFVSNESVRKTSGPMPFKTYYKSAIAEKLMSVFKPDALGRLTRRSTQGRQRCEVSAKFSEEHVLSFSFNTASQSHVTVDHATSTLLEKRPAYLPTRELLSIYPGFVSVYETTHLEFDETWRDTCVLLGSPLARGPRERRIKDLLIPIENAMGGKVELTSGGRFYLNVEGVRMEMHLVAEGLRKLAMIARLIATGALIDKGYLFWDEPEANLNSKVVKIIARTVLDLCLNGIQVFIASHSLFLLRELDILLNTPNFAKVSSRFIGLHPSEVGVEVSQGHRIDDVGEIDALQEELSQSDRYLEEEDNS